MSTYRPPQPPSTSVPGGGTATPASDRDAHFAAVRASSEFQQLKRRWRLFTFPVVAVALAWYASFILLSAYAPEFMSIRVMDNITLGLVLGLSQVVTTFIITLLYVRFADTVLDPAAERLRLQVEAGPVGTAGASS